MLKPGRARTALLTGLLCYLALQLLLDGVLDGLWSPDYRRKLDSLRQARETSPQAKTVVVLGSSRTANGLKPSVIQPLLAEQLDEPVLVYNFGFPGNGPVVNLLHLRRLLADDVRPDLLLIEVLPAVLSVTQNPPGDTGSVFLPPTSMRYDEIRIVRRYAGHVKRNRYIDWFLSRIAPSYYLRPRILTASAPWLLPPEDLFHHIRQDERGWIPLDSILTRPEARPRILETSRKSFADMFKNFAPGGPNVAALEEMLGICNKERIPVALVHMPEGPTFRSWYPPGTHDAVMALLTDLTRKYGASFMDAQRWVEDENKYIDSHHLLSAGAEVFSRRLGEEVLVPLLRRRSSPETSNVTRSR